MFVLEISLEKIELVKDRTGVSYKEAKEALENAGGNVVDAIIYIEETIDAKNKTKFGDGRNEMLEKLKEIVKKGNVSKIIFKKDDDVILNIPVNAGVIGFALAPWAALAGTAAALVSKCKIEIVKDNGEVVDFNELTNGKFDEFKNKAEEVKNKAEAAFDSMKSKMDEKKSKESKKDEEDDVDTEKEE